jgi:hypothetical protein
MDEQLYRGAMHNQRDKEVSEMLWKVVGCWLLLFSSSHHGMDMFVVVVLLLLLHRATCETPSSCDIHGPQDSVIFNDLTQANGID